MITCIRGGGSNHPCPTCLIHRDNIPDLPHDANSDECRLRTTANMQEIYNQAQAINNKKERNALLRDHGLREVEVCLI